ncbi:MAG: hypothetical protein COX44_02605 [Candidatus Portnoybacteria bacterium CG23_combo_of_CG06-09_8_20_14_all_37_13]|uniref:Uncharacterized protein n=1 Tax=Candidatus Portnoybacteria bacterium CG23_combo_of_CG06-09_8_20_14_all_37_13 TaxID=1974819 RepID=A0A2G9YCL4_9BACT|nr:MAG: hypothetical protein COX44_02605 [Candidatus Portnoybacteria bacterium CG23_combo_of_CG06-09_8_20_14_all_37_13]
MNNKIAYLILGVVVLVIIILFFRGEKMVDQKNIVILEGQKVSLACNIDNDCLLINRDLGFGCGLAGFCDSIDYSLNKYIAVNVKSFLGLKEKNCEPLPEVTPFPMCAVQIINDNFFAKCISGICAKVPK